MAALVLVLFYVIQQQIDELKQAEKDVVELKVWRASVESTLDTQKQVHELQQWKAAVEARTATERSAGSPVTK